MHRNSFSWVMTYHLPSRINCISWWRHQMETFSELLAICAGNSPVIGEFPAQRPVTRSFGVFFDLRPNKRLNKQSWGWWFETPSRTYDVIVIWKQNLPEANQHKCEICFRCVSDLLPFLAHIPTHRPLLGWWYFFPNKQCMLHKIMVHQCIQILLLFCWIQKRFLQFQPTTNCIPLRATRKP